ncbi:MAG: zinc-binding dehydrogenase [Ignavibacteria bacterium]|jgi:NADPH2:quinone reductase
MKAVFLNENGGTDKLIYRTDFPEPHIKNDEVLVKVMATSINRADTIVRAGYPGLSLNFPHILGGDIAGVVEKTGSGVKDFHSGDRIICWPITACGKCEWCLKGRKGLCFNWQYFGMHRWGGYAEFTSVPESSLIKLPENVSFEDATSLPVAGLTAYYAVTGVGDLKRGESFFIWGGTSGLGLIAVQIAKSIGAEIFATAGQEDKIEKLKQMGVDHVFDHYHDDNIVDKVLKLTEGRGVDVVLDYVGPATHSRSFQMVKKGGKILWCGIMSGREANVSIHQTYLRHISLLGLYLGEKHELEALVKLCSEGKIKPHIYQKLDLKDAAEGHKLMESGNVMGKIVMVP